MTDLTHRFADILDAIDDGIFIYDGNSRVVFCNKKACQIFGYSKEQLLGLKVGEVITLPAVTQMIVPNFGGESLTDICHRHTNVSDYSLPGCVVFRSGHKMLYNGTFIRDDRNLLLFAVYTLRELNDINVANRRIKDLERLTGFYSEQLGVAAANLVGYTPIIVDTCTQSVYKQAVKYAQMNANLLIVGETGTGKSALAKYIHFTGPRNKGPFLTVNCASLPESLVEAELFGYQQGAFTGASRQGHQGLIEAAEGGTLLLDDVSEMPLSVQAKLLAVVESKELRRLGSSKPSAINVRFIGATNCQGERLKSALREDLLYRLSALRLYVPPLRERSTDIPALITHALNTYNADNDTDVALGQDIIDLLACHPLPGNIRQLRSIVWAIASNAEPGAGGLGLRDLSQSQRTELVGDFDSGREAALPPPGVNEEERYLRELCDAHGGDVRAIALALGVHRTTVLRRLQRYNINYRRKVWRVRPLQTSS